ncbi:hypothetical protein HMPREF9503_02568 [Enterococcus faecalis TX0043]|nr:hypothetical protein HMPREF9503_02568 [Enterococcus faecalis TX0043]
MLIYQRFWTLFIHLKSVFFLFRNDFSIRSFFKCCLWQAQSHLARQHLFCFS